VAGTSADRSAVSGRRGGGVSVTPVTQRQVHHSAICVRDVSDSLRFYRDGLGLAVLMDESFDGDWPMLFDADSLRLRSVMLGDPNAPDAGIVELVQFDALPEQVTETGNSSGEPSRARDDDGEAGPPEGGFFLLSLFVDVDATLARLDGLGLGGEPRRIDQPAPGGSTVPMATVRDPDGVLIELIGAPA
jgi:catechol 2,3-dioxygenase-like lactoylglutathione lyase family enzyme